MRKSVISWLEDSANKYGDRTVFDDGKNSLGFIDLFDKSRAVGTAIAKLAEISAPIAVMTGRHVYTPACYLGVAYAGCFYAPMDAELPDYRLNQILEIITPEYMIVDDAGKEKAEAIGFTGNILPMEELFGTAVDEELLKMRQEGITEFSPLYTIFTSGSTGKPKAVLTSHYSLMCYLDGLNSVIRINQEDVLANQSPLDYIAAVRDIYLPLMTGAQTVIIPKEIHAMPEELFRVLNEKKVTVLCWSAAGLELPAKLNAFDLGRPEKVRTVVFSGSVIPGKYLKAWQDNLPDARFINQYGPTETTASCTYYEVTEKVSDETVLPIGKPFKHYKVFLLTEEGTEPAPGEEGEICVAGPALALGYYGDKEQTDKAFIQNPLQNKYREMIYLTGDLGRMNKDGNLEFLGRKDRQIKYMGHRVELSEIESTALRIEGVEECCSLYDMDRERICLFYSGSAEAKEITLFFRNNMPGFMVPRRIKQMTELPRLHNGKLDMKSLKEEM